MDASAVRPALWAVPRTTGEESAYRRVAASLRAAIVAGRYPAGRKLPTENELVDSTGLSRQTIRRAFQELVSEGVIFRIHGRGTSALPRDERCLRSFGSIDALMALAIDTEMQVVEPLHVLASVEIADRLRTGEDLVMSTSFLRLHEGVPFCYTQVHLPMVVGGRLQALPELAQLAKPGAHAAFTMISLVDRVSDRPTHSAEQEITATAASTDIAHRLGCPPGLPVLRIDRLYRDRDSAAQELAINHFHPNYYFYRLQLRGRMDRPRNDGGTL